ncbi:uncharacterized protein LOC109863109 isoform X2 [Pseudomyrmex gracilis]|uniref:uncharacterized protein LOC109863109 isoform X2 n=1 Tax=Pseudomyrmex gracilis TaxID=219809 RepID=UPI000995CF96|nr:uncharacterized protein LOC109863109 isoform X2 [Pseudomyrmex gracilis]
MMWFTPTMIKTLMTNRKTMIRMMIMHFHHKQAVLKKKASKKLHDNPGVHESVKEIVCESQSCQSMPEQKTSDSFKDTETTSKSLVNQMHLNLLQELHRKVDWLSINMSRILDELFPDESRFDRLQGFPSLSLNTENDLAEFESYLKNKPIFNNMMKYLGEKGKGESHLLRTPFWPSSSPTNLLA